MIDNKLVLVVDLVDPKLITICHLDNIVKMLWLYDYC